MTVQLHPRWRHQMETFSASLTLCSGNSPVTGEFPSQRPVTRSFGVFFDLRLNYRLSKQSWGWWLETPSRSFCRHCNAFSCMVLTSVPVQHPRGWNCSDYLGDRLLQQFGPTVQLPSTTAHGLELAQWQCMVTRSGNLGAPICGPTTCPECVSTAWACYNMGPFD